MIAFCFTPSCFSSCTLTHTHTHTCERETCCSFYINKAQNKEAKWQVTASLSARSCLTQLFPFEAPLYYCVCLRVCKIIPLILHCPAQRPCSARNHADDFINCARQSMKSVYITQYLYRLYVCITVTAILLPYYICLFVCNLPRDSWLCDVPVLFARQEILTSREFEPLSNALWNTIKSPKVNYLMA